MKLHFSRQGRQFFFFTFCVEGRQPLLSHLVPGPVPKAAAGGAGGAAPRPLTAISPGCAGGAGGAAPRPLAAIFPGYAGGAGGAAPRPLDGGGNELAHAVLHPPGEAVLRWLLALHSSNPALTLSNRVFMPDHVHFVLIVDFDRDPTFDLISFAQRFRNEAGMDTAPLFRWEQDFWLVLSFSQRQLAAIRRYIRGNPARALWKKAHPNRFQVLEGIRHPSLDTTLYWSAMGDATLLASPFRFPVRLTRKIPVEGQAEALSEAVERTHYGMIPVCGFISPAEHELERRLRDEPAARWIKTVPHGLKPGYDPSLEDNHAIAEGRLLLLSSFPPEIPVSPISRANCEVMNSRIITLFIAKGRGATPPAPPL